jgi:hypothetical protein
MTNPIQALKQTSADSSFWPVTVAGWGTLILSTFTIAGGVFALGKFYAALNGLGARVTDMEKDQEKAEGEKIIMQRQIDRTLDQHESLIARVAESKKSAEKCDEDTVELGILIGSKIDAVGRDLNAMNLHLSQRMKAVETVLKLKE